MPVKLLTDHHLECLSLSGGCTGSSECIHVKMPHCWKSHVVATEGSQSFSEVWSEVVEVMRTILQYGLHAQGWGYSDIFMYTQTRDIFWFQNLNFNILYRSF